MLKNSFLGRRDENSSTAGNGRASLETPRYAPNQEAAPLSSIAVTPPAQTSAASSNTATTPVQTTAKQTEALASSTTTSTAGPRLTVGPNIKLKGAEINDCDTLVVEGHVEASMDSHTLEILKTGSYAGTVTIDVAEIHGRFEGNLTARKKLIVHESGVVSGTVRYGSLLVSEGGVVSGDVASLNNGSGKADDQQQALFAGYPSSRIGGKGNGAAEHAAA